MEADKSQGFRELKRKKTARICVLIQWLSYPLKHVSIVLSIVTFIFSLQLTQIQPLAELNSWQMAGMDLGHP